jgi:hypothetical protein
MSISYIVSKVGETRLESLVITSEQWVRGDWDYYTKELGYNCKIHTIEHCDNCGGTGRLQKRRGKKILKWEYKECPVCKAERKEEIDVTEKMIALWDDENNIL